ncbi:hypothetical protein RHSIM_Rhsim04G0211100 [Rhododendron simsii]|uniref:F-box associated beta-propeller type 3 domain-containing protein n=1 Tax=Rhododendron simsii TaxID=118357 RepID=A0A834LMY2_RHOSS|nr:hypothetical protein RHSIM_Rhsim04G0211100 [Rhododendron simsii]
MDYQAPDPTVAKLEMPGKSAGVEIWGSFNGVLLVDIDEELCLWNPSIRIYQRISRPSCTRSWITYALGYDSINDDFKVVGAVPATRDGLSRPPYTSDGPSTVHVFSSKLSSWKSIGDFDYPCSLYGPGIVVNGAPHWFWHGITDIDDGEVVMRFKLEASAKLAIYNPKQKTYKRIVMPQDLEGFDVSLYVESLVSPHGCKRAVLEGTAN